MWVYKDGELQHHGVKGQKWGVRRYQTKSGKLTSAGKKRYLLGFGSKKKTEDSKAKASSSTKSVKDMSDDELRKTINRLQLEKQYRDLNPQKVSFGRKFVNEAVMPALMEASKSVIKDAFVDVGKQIVKGNKKKN